MPPWSCSRHPAATNKPPTLPTRSPNWNGKTSRPSSANAIWSDSSKIRNWPRSVTRSNANAQKSKRTALPWNPVMATPRRLRKRPSVNASWHWRNARGNSRQYRQPWRKNRTSCLIAGRSSPTASGIWREARRCRSKQSIRPCRWGITGCFMIRCPRMARGSRPQTTATSGSRWWCGNPVGSPIRAAAGFAATGAGPGSPKSRSVGPPITTDAGPCSAGAAGSGCRVRNGHRAGSAGVKTTPTSVGRRCRRRLSPIVAATGILAWKSGSASERLLSIS